MNQLKDFAALAQHGQELSRESCWPAEILLADGTAPLACSGGSFADADHQLEAGGFFASYAASFRVRAALLGGAIPAVGDTLQWRRAGETDWRPALRIMRVATPANDVSIVLGCEEVVKA